MKLTFIKFIYNNFIYFIIKILLFFIIYDFYFIIELNVKDNILKKEVLIIIKRIKKI